LHEFSLFNQILLNLFNVSDAFYDHLSDNVEVKMC